MIEMSYDYIVTVHYSHGGGRVFNDVCLPYLTDDLLDGTRVLTFDNKDGEIFCVNFDNVQAYSYMKRPEVEETPENEVEIVEK